MIYALIDVVLPVFLVIAAGYGLTRVGYFKSSYVDGLTVFTQGFAIPCLLFRATRDLDLATVLNPGLMLSYYVGATIAFVLTMLGARMIFRRRPGEAVAIGFGAFFSNSVLLGLAITERAFGTSALEYNFAIIAVHAPFCYGVGILVMEITRSDGAPLGKTLRLASKAMFRNPLMIGIGLGFLVNVTGFDAPRAFNNALDLVVQAALPAAIFGLGGILTRYRIRDKLSQVGLIAVFSLLVHPAITLGLGTLVFDLSDPMLRSAVVTAAMAPGVNAYLFAATYGRATGVVSSAVLLCTILSVVTATFWLSLLPA